MEGFHEGQKVWVAHADGSSGRASSSATPRSRAGSAGRPPPTSSIRTPVGRGGLDASDHASRGGRGDVRHASATAGRRLDPDGAVGRRVGRGPGLGAGGAERLGRRGSGGVGLRVARRPLLPRLDPAGGRRLRAAAVDGARPAPRGRAARRVGGGGPGGGLAAAAARRAAAPGPGRPGARGAHLRSHRGRRARVRGRSRAGERRAMAARGRLRGVPSPRPDRGPRDLRGALPRCRRCGGRHRPRHGGGGGGGRRGRPRLRAAGLRRGPRRRWHRGRRPRVRRPHSARRAGRSSTRSATTSPKGRRGSWPW